MPTFSDPELQACFDEQVATHGWVWAEDVDQLLCPSRFITDAGGLHQLPNLTKLDLSNNPFNTLEPLHGLEHKLTELNLSGTALHNLPDLPAFTALRQLLLNDTRVTDSLISPSQLEQTLNQVVINNPQLEAVGFNGFALSDPLTLVNNLPPELLSLALSRTGLRAAPVPLPLERFTQLQVLDLSHNPLEHLGSLYGLANTLTTLNLSGTTLHVLPDLQALRQLRQLLLNDIQFDDPYVSPTQLEQLLSQVVINNPRLEAVGFNGFTLSDPLTLFNNLPPGMVSLALSRTGLQTLPVPLEQFTQLQVLDLSHNPLEHLGSLYGLAHTLTSLNLSGTSLHTLPDLQALTQLRQLWLNDIPLDDPAVSPTQLEQLLNQVVVNNPRLEAVGFNGFALSDPVTLLNNLPPELLSLALSRTGLRAAPGPLPLERFTQLQALDLSHNPLEHLGSLYGLAHTLTSLNLSGTSLHTLPDLQALTQLRQLWLNDIQLDNPVLSPTQLEQLLNQVVMNNPRLEAVGFNGFALSDPVTLLNNLPPELLSLALSRTGLRATPLPLPLERFTQLQVLDLSHNPFGHLGSLYGLAHTLTSLNLSGTTLHVLPDLQALRQLRQLLLNDIPLDDPYVSPTQLEQLLNQVVINNPRLEAVGFNGFALSDPLTLFNNLPPGMVSLALSRTGLQTLPVPLEQFTRLQVLDLSHNPLEAVGPLHGLARTLTSLNLSGTSLYTLPDLQALTQLRQLWLNDIPLDDPYVSPTQLEQLLNQVVVNNPRLEAVGFSGFALSDPVTLLNNLPPELLSLALSRTGLRAAPGPLPLERFTQLQALDLSHNPLEAVGSLYGLANTLTALNLSGTTLYNLPDLPAFTALRQLLLNDTRVTDSLISPSQLEQTLNQVVINNPRLEAVGFNGFALSDPVTLLNNLPPELLSLALSRTGLRAAPVPLPLERFTQLQVLDLSHNPLEHLGSLYGLAHTLTSLNLSGTTLHVLPDLQILTELRQLLLNDIQLDDPVVSPTQLEQLLNQVVVNNPRLEAVGFNGFALSDPLTLFNNLPPGMASLALSRTGLQTLPVPLEQFTQLQVLDLSHNPLEHLGSLYGLAHTLTSLNLSGTSLHTLPDLQALTQLRQLWLNDIPLDDPAVSPTQLEQLLNQVVVNNPRLEAVGFNGFALSDPVTLLNNLPPELLSLALSRTGLRAAPGPLPLERFTQLQALDLSHNPLESVGPLHGLAHTLTSLNLSGATLYNLPDLPAFTALRQLLLNDTRVTDPLINPSQLEQTLNQVVINNPRLEIVGFNGFALSDPVTLLNNLPPELLSLALSRTGLRAAPVPLPLERFTQLQVLDLSHNPLESVGSLHGLAHTLTSLNLSGTTLYNLPDLPAFTALRQLLLNDTRVTDPLITPSQLEQTLNQVVVNNPRLEVVGFNGFAISDPLILFNNLPPGLVSLALSRTGLQTLPVPLEQFTQLQALDLSANPLASIGPMAGLADTLERLNLSHTHLQSLSELIVLVSLTELNVNHTQPPVNYDTFTLNQILANNPALSHVGLSGIQFNANDIITTLSGLPITWLDVSNTGITDVNWPVSLTERLRYLNAGNNMITSTLGLGPAIKLEHLYLDNNQLMDINDLLIANVDSFRLISLLGNNNLACSDLDALEPRTLELIRPTSCQ